jgi:hypothetical protein
MQSFQKKIMAKQKVKPCTCTTLCDKYTQSGTEYADDVETMKICPHFQAQPPRNHGQIKFIGHDGHETTYPPAGIATVCGRCKTDCQSVAHTDDFGWVCDRCLVSQYC